MIKIDKESLDIILKKIRNTYLVIDKILNFLPEDERLIIIRLAEGKHIQDIQKELRIQYTTYLKKLNHAISLLADLLEAVNNEQVTN